MASARRGGPGVAHEWQYGIDEFVRRHDLDAAVPVPIEMVAETEGIHLRFAPNLEPVYA